MNECRNLDISDGKRTASKGSQFSVIGISFPKIGQEVNDEWVIASDASPMVEKYFCLGVCPRLARRLEGCGSGNGPGFIEEPDTIADDRFSGFTII